MSLSLVPLTTWQCWYRLAECRLKNSGKTQDTQQFISNQSVIFLDQVIKRPAHADSENVTRETLAPGNVINLTRDVWWWPGVQVCRWIYPEVWRAGQSLADDARVTSVPARRLEVTLETNLHGVFTTSERPAFALFSRLIKSQGRHVMTSSYQKVWKLMGISEQLPESVSKNQTCFV
ncbi:hypothetical protein BaRGS_00004528 [Batillaria attramentaria]|uniref:Uncharacterized protein n=1 Tax=Batillaria attramentaria TaxID=370345 RepID=A0ABD0LXB3_9CAEN